MKIHLITNLFAPDELAGASLYTDMARFFRDGGHDVRVTCTFSYYPAWKLRSEDQGVSERLEEFEGIPVKRVRMYVPRIANGKSRLLSDLSFLFSLIRRGKFTDAWRPDVVLTAEPMLSQCLAQRFLYFGTNIPRLIVVQDFVVDAALELGILKIPFAKRALRALERWALGSAQTITTIGAPMLDKLRQIGPKRCRMELVHNWIHGSLETLIDQRRHHAPARDRGVLFYAGNIGVKQNLPAFIDDFLIDPCNWQLNVHGGGAELSLLQQKILGRTEITLGNVLDEQTYVDRLLTCSACLITQQHGVSANFLPSKILPALAAGTPILAICDLNTPLGREVADNRIGVVVPPGNPAALRAVLNQWSRNSQELEDLGKNARNRASFFGRNFILRRYENLLKDLIAP